VVDVRGHSEDEPLAACQNPVMQRTLADRTFRHGKSPKQKDTNNTLYPNGSVKSLILPKTW